MKYIRKFVAMMIGIIFFVAAVICVGTIFAVKNINVTLLTYSDDYSESYAEIKQTLSVFKGESIFFIDEEEIIGSVVENNSSYAVTACNKVYPCTLNVTLKERLETFAVSVGGQYSMYNNEGGYLRSNAVNSNITDGSPNVELIHIAVEDIGEVAGIASLFKDKFNSLRSLVVSIEVDSDSEIELYTEKLFFNLRCGLKIEIDDYKVSVEEKLDAAYEKFNRLTDRQKLGGTLRCFTYGGAGGEIRADYSSI